jgi:deoxyadenosine/deoxycytidine kinase
VEARLSALRPTARTFDVIEVVGVAGAGKSSVTRALAETTDLHAVSRNRSARNVPMYLAGAAAMAPILVHARSTDFACWRGCNKMVRLRSSRSIARRHQRHGRARPKRRACSGLIFDQGPLFLVSALDRDHRPGTASDRYARWRASELRHWQRTLDLVVVLDGDDDVLLDRIKSRRKPHQVTSLGDRSARRWLADARSRIDEVLAEITSPTVTIARVDTSTAPLQGTVAEVLASVSSLHAPATPHA